MWSDFYRYFSLGDKLGQGASAKVFKGTIKKKGKGGGAMVCAIKRVRKFQLKERKKKALFREVITSDTVGDGIWTLNGPIQRWLILFIPVVTCVQRRHTMFSPTAS